MHVETCAYEIVFVIQKRREQEQKFHVTQLFAKEHGQQTRPQTVNGEARGENPNGTTRSLEKWEE